jgi:hypothetical protein
MTDKHAGVGPVDHEVRQHLPVPTGTGMFDEWMQNPYTKVLMQSIDRDYVPRVDAEKLCTDAERYRWLRTAGAWESEIGMDVLSEQPELFDAAVDARIAGCW